MNSATNEDAPAETGDRLFLFHIVIEDLGRTFTIDGPGDSNGVRIHFEMLQTARALKGRYRHSDMRFHSPEEARSYMLRYFPGYAFLGTWTFRRSQETRFLSEPSNEPR